MKILTKSDPESRNRELLDSIALPGQDHPAGERSRGQLPATVRVGSAGRQVPRGSLGDSREDPVMDRAGCLALRRFTFVAFSGLFGVFGLMAHTGSNIFSHLADYIFGASRFFGPVVADVFVTGSARLIAHVPEVFPASILAAFYVWWNSIGHGGTMLQMTDEMQALLWAVNYRLGQLRERLKWECIDATNGTPCSSDKVRRLEGNIGALEQVDRWIQGKEEMPSAV